ncbi:MAG: hypothetical protein QM504_10900 [Pseudomonadota bacterium]
MNNIRFEIDGKTVTRNTPEEWNELTLKQLLFVVPRVMFVNKSRRLRSEILFNFLGKEIKGIEGLNQSQLNALFAAVDWLFKVPQLTINLLPKVEILKIVFNGPEDELKDISVSQFAFADKFMSQFLKSRDEQYLDLVIGALYVRHGHKFVKEEIEATAAYIKHLPLDKRLAILAFFMGSRHKIAEQNKDIFKKSNKVRRSKSGWLGFFYELAGPKIGNYNQVADMNFFEMLGIMRKINEDARETEKRNRKRK